MAARRRSRAGASGFGLALLLLVACGGGASSPAPPSADAPMSGAMLATAMPSVSGNLGKVDEVFLELLALYQAQGLSAATQFARAQGLMTANDEVRLTLVLDSADTNIVDGTALSVGRLGGRVTATYDNQIEMVIPIQAAMEYGRQTNTPSFFADLADFSHVKDIRRTPVAQQT